MGIKFRFYTKTITDRIKTVEIQGVPLVEVSVSQFLLDDNDAQAGKSDLSVFNWYHHNKLSNILDNLSHTWLGSKIHVGEIGAEVVLAQPKFWSIDGLKYLKYKIKCVSYKKTYALCSLYRVY